MIHLGDFPVSHTAVCIPFDSFAAATGASSATSNFASSDILVYKDAGTTQRTSANGITVTTSFDSQTGLNMILIDLSDNTDVGFYAAGHEYQVGVADITIDAQTVRFWAATFSIERASGVLAKLVAGTAKVDVTKWLTGTIPAVTTTGVPLVDTKYLTGTLQTARDIGASVLLSTGTGTGQLDFTSGVVKANLAQILGTALTETAGLLAGGFKKFFNVATPTGTLNSIPDAVPDASGGLPVTGNRLTAIPTIATVTTLTNLPAITSNWLTAAGIAAAALNGKGDWNIGKTGYALSAAGVQANWDALTSALTTASSIGKLLVDNVNATISSRLASASYTAPLDAAGTRTAVGLASANLDTQLDALPTNAELATALGTADDAVLAVLGTPAGASLAADVAAVKVVDLAIKAKTDSLTFTQAGQVDANIQYVNDVQVNGVGSSGSPWGP